MKEEIKLSSKIENNGNEISLITIATYNDKEYDLQDLLNNLLNELQRKDNIINELEKWLIEKSEILHKICGDNWTTVRQAVYESVLDKIKELESKGEKN